MSIGKRIREQRKLLSLTQRELSNNIGLSPKMVSFYENDQRVPPADMVIKLAQIFNVSADYLLGISESNNVPKNDSLLFHLNTQEKNLISNFRKLDSDYKNIVLGELNKCLKYQEQENTSKKIPPATKEA